MSLTPFAEDLTLNEMEVNVREIAIFLTSQGWSLQAIAAACGNFQSECRMNPNNPQRPSGFPTSSTSRAGGFGLPQWTPWYDRYGTWCNDNGIAITATDENPSGQLIPQLLYLEYECVNGWNGGRTWYPNQGYNYTWQQFKASTDDPAELARAFYWQYERSGAQSPTTRPAQATYWYSFLTGTPLNPPPLWLLLKIKRNRRLYL